MKQIIILLAILFLCGCTRLYHRKTWSYSRNFEIGQKIDFSYWGHDPVDKISLNSEQDKYIFKEEFEDGYCEWSTTVNKETNVVESWEYIGEPKKCWIGINYWGPW